ncbi:F-box protein At2g02240-like [Andrographis paniculata]|uniref:F-box protein At2g02240-like n=1 Tax=Andrographis paniculata TaxID=175694 RepID=UPI0021E7335F|nr:F-box protein At2g02240-like [Andrographis paniculata]
MGNPFEKVPEGCISEILSLTSAWDASRSSLISKAFKSAADSDAVWNRFLPQDWPEILSRADSAAVINYRTKKDLFFTLSHNFLLIDGAKLSFCLDRRNGKKCYLIGARELLISWKNCWYFAPHPNSRFSEAAWLKSIGWIHIQGRIRSEALSQNTTYAAYLVFWHQTKEALKSSNTIVRFLDHHGTTEHLASQETGKIGHQRRDGWMEIEMGKFYNAYHRYDEVEVWLIEINSPHGKSGLIVEGIEFRPV